MTFQFTETFGVKATSKVTLTFFVMNYVKLTFKQNRESTEGYSKGVVRKNNDKLGKRIGLNK